MGKGIKLRSLRSELLAIFPNYEQIKKEKDQSKSVYNEVLSSRAGEIGEKILMGSASRTIKGKLGKLKGARRGRPNKVKVYTKEEIEQINRKGGIASMPETEKEKTKGYVGDQRVINYINDYVAELGSDIPYTIINEEYERLTKAINAKFKTTYHPASIRNQVRQTKRDLGVTSYKRAGNIVIDGKIRMNFNWGGYKQGKTISKEDDFTDIMKMTVQRMSEIIEKNKQLETANAALADENKRLKELLLATKKIREACGEFNEAFKRGGFKNGD